jgi:Arc/MetJ-type ribon-helix-helix transcriptional regulator
MSTISVPITVEQEKFINEMVKSGKAANKAHVVRYAIQRLSEEEAVEAVLESERELAAGKGLRGDLRTLLKKVK